MRSIRVREVHVMGRDQCGEIADAAHELVNRMRNTLVGGLVIQIAGRLISQQDRAAALANARAIATRCCSPPDKPRRPMGRPGP